MLLSNAFIDQLSPECLTSETEVQNPLLENESLAFELKAGRNIHGVQWRGLAVHHLFLNPCLQVIDVDLASEGVASVTILQLDKESFVGTAHIGMIEEGFL